MRAGARHAEGPGVGPGGRSVDAVRDGGHARAAVVGRQDDRLRSVTPARVHAGLQAGRLAGRRARVGHARAQRAEQRPTCADRAAAPRVGERDPGEVLGRGVRSVRPRSRRRRRCAGWRRRRRWPSRRRRRQRPRPERSGVAGGAACGAQAAPSARVQDGAAGAHRPAVGRVGEGHGGEVLRRTRGLGRPGGAVARVQDGAAGAHGPAVGRVGEGHGGEVLRRDPRASAAQVVPSLVCRMVPPAPTAQPSVASAKATAERSGVAGGAVSASQVTPPSVVCRMVPAAPTAQPSVASTKATAVRSCVVPDTSAIQAAPPSPVCRMAPAAPTAQPSPVPLNATAARSALVPELRAVQPAAAQAAVAKTATTTRNPAARPAALTRHRVGRAMAPAPLLLASSRRCTAGPACRASVVRMRFDSGRR